MENTLDRIIITLKRKGVADAALINHIKPGSARTIVRDWKMGRSKSYIKYLPEIAEFLGVSESYLRCETEDPEPRLASDDPLLQIYENLSPENRKELQKIASWLEIKQKQERKSQEFAVDEKF